MPYPPDLKPRTIRFLTNYNSNRSKESNKLAYLAGIIDGEGYVKVEKWGVVRLVVGMTDYRTIRWIYDTFGGTLSKPQILKSKKRFYVWRLNDAFENLKLMVLIYPYLICKKQLVLETLRLLKQRLLKHRGFETLKGLHI